MAQAKVLQNTQAKPVVAASATAGEVVKKQRNKRAVITDYPELTDATRAAFDKAISASESAWKHIVKTLSENGVRLGTHFKAADGQEFYADVLKYPLATALRLAQSRQHNKLMDSYSDPVEAPDVIHEVRSVDAELVKGVWSQRGEGTPRFTLLERAVAELYGKSLEQASEELEKAGISKVSDFKEPEPFRVKIEEIKQRDATARLSAARDKAKGVSLPKLFG